MILYAIWAACVGLAIYFYLDNLTSRFRKHGVKFLAPFPIFGNMSAVVFRQEHVVDHLQRIYNAFPNERFFGRFQFSDLFVMVSDIELIKKVTIKDFEHFVDHNVIIDENSDPLFGRNLLSLKGMEWKNMRASLSPAFTSSKIRGMVPFIVEVGDQMTKILTQKTKNSGKHYIDVDLKDLSTRYANDVIASCAFGVKVNSHADEDNEFYTMGKMLTTFKLKQILKFFLFAGFPKVMKLLKITLFSGAIKKFFTALVLGTMKDREDRNIIRPDMTHLLMEAKKGLDICLPSHLIGSKDKDEDGIHLAIRCIFTLQLKTPGMVWENSDNKGKLTHDKSSKDESAGFATVEESALGKNEITKEWTNDDLVAQAVLFLFAGFETVSSAMAFLFYELAVNPEVQENLYQEIRETDAACGGKIDYDIIQKMYYMDMVVSEVLRLWPPVGLLDRVCVKDYNLGRANDKATEDYIIRKGEHLAIVAWAIHRDPQYYENPLKFDPERFSDENKHNIKPFTYMPFGVGPRNCIGSRFALAEVKLMAYQLIKHMELSPGPTTQIPAVLNIASLNLQLKGGNNIRMRLRQ